MRLSRTLPPERTAGTCTSPETGARRKPAAHAASAAGASPSFANDVPVAAHTVSRTTRLHGSPSTDVRRPAGHVRPPSQTTSTVRNRTTRVHPRPRGAGPPSRSDRRIATPRRARVQRNAHGEAPSATIAQAAIAGSCVAARNATHRWRKCGFLFSSLTRVAGHAAWNRRHSTTAGSTPTQGSAAGAEWRHCWFCSPSRAARHPHRRTPERQANRLASLPRRRQPSATHLPIPSRARHRPQRL